MGRRKQALETPELSWHRCGAGRRAERARVAHDRRPGLERGQLAEPEAAKARLDQDRPWWSARSGARPPSRPAWPQLARDRRPAQALPPPALDLGQARGGTWCRQRCGDVPGVGRIAILKDPTGAALGCMVPVPSKPRATTSDPAFATKQALPTRAHERSHSAYPSPPASRRAACSSSAFEASLTSIGILAPRGASGCVKALLQMSQRSSRASGDNDLRTTYQALDDAVS